MKYRLLKKYILFFIYLIIFEFIVFSEPLVNGFGLYYRTPFENGKKELKNKGFKVTKTEYFKDSNTDRKYIRVNGFIYENIPYINGTFSFDRDVDGKYYFSMSEGDVDIEKINNDMDSAIYFALWLEQLKEKSDHYESMQFDKNTILHGFSFSNGGMILLAESDKLHVSYHPKNMQW